MIIKSNNNLEYHCHDWDEIFKSHIMLNDPVENFTISDERKIIIEELDKIKKNVFIDVGAHLGFWSIFMSGHFENVMSFEPNIETFELLEKNTKKLKNIRLYNNALGNEECYVDVKYHIGYDTNLNQTYDKGKNLNSGMCRTIKTESGIKCLTIDSLNLKNLDMVKIDCEGYELFVLQGGLNTIQKYKPIIIMETNGLEELFLGLSKNSSENFLFDLGYEKIYSPEPGKTSDSIYKINK